MKGDIGKALTLIDKSLNLAPNKMGVSILKLFILYYKTSLDETISFALTLINQNNGSNPIISAMMALLIALKGHKDKAKSLLVKFDTSSNPDYISANTLYTKYLLYGDPIKTDIMKFLSGINVSSVNGIMLPLIFTAYGKKSSTNAGNN